MKRKNLKLIELFARQKQAVLNNKITFSNPRKFARLSQSVQVVQNTSVRSSTLSIVALYTQPAAGGE